MKKLFLLLSAIGFNIFSLDRFANLATHFEQTKKTNPNYFQNPKNWKISKKNKFNNPYLKEKKINFGFQQGCPKGNKKY